MNPLVKELYDHIEEWSYVGFVIYKEGKWRLRRLTQEGTHACFAELDRLDDASKAS